MFERDLAGGSAAELEMGIKSPVACLVVQVKAWGASPCLTVGSQTGCPDLHIPAGTWSFSSLLYKRVPGGFYSQQELVVLRERTRARPKACEWMGAGMAKASQKLNDSPGDTSDPENSNKFTQLLHQAFARPSLCLWVTLSSPSLPLSRVPTPPRTCGEMEGPRLPAAGEGRPANRKTARIRGRSLPLLLARR